MLQCTRATGKWERADQVNASIYYWNEMSNSSSGNVCVDITDVREHFYYYILSCVGYSIQLSFFINRNCSACDMIRMALYLSNVACDVQFKILLIFHIDAVLFRIRFALLQFHIAAKIDGNTWRWTWTWKWTNKEWNAFSLWPMHSNQFEQITFIQRQAISFQRISHCHAKRWQCNIKPKYVEWM